MSRMPTMDELLRDLRERVEALETRKSIVPSQNPSLDSAIINGDLTVVDDLAVGGTLDVPAIELGGADLANTVRLNRSYLGTVSAQDFPGVLISGGVSSYPSKTPMNLPIVLDETGTVVYAAAIANSGMVGNQLWPGDRVMLTLNTGGGWVATKIQPKRYLIEGFANSVYDHYDNTYQEGSVYLMHDGWAVWQGLNINVPATTTGTVLFTLPPELIPKWLVGKASTQRTRFNVYWGDTNLWIDIFADGSVRGATAYASRATYSGWTGLMYPTASATETLLKPGAQGSSTTEPTWANNFLDYNGSSGADPSFEPFYYVIDSYNVFHAFGMVKNPATFPAANAPIIAFGSNHGADFQNHFPVYDSGVGFTYVGADNGTSGHSSNGLNYKAGGTVSGWTCLSNVRIPMLGNTISWLDTRGGNGWVRYVAGGATLFSPIQFGCYRQTRILRGLMTGGSALNTYYSPIPRGFRPVNNLWESQPVATNGLLFAAVSNAAKGRLDIKAFGQAFAQAGSTTWFCADGMVYIPET